MRSKLLIGVGALLLGGFPSARLNAEKTDSEKQTPNSIEVTGGRCQKESRHCFGLAIHYVGRGRPEGPNDRKWLAKQIKAARRHFSAIDVSFEIASENRHPKVDSKIYTRLQRDELGATRVDTKGASGLIHIFIVDHLADVDAPASYIRGVHWRLRRDTSRRWIILSRISMPDVLAHELGHYFGLPHSTYPISIMNKRPREKPPHNERRFHDKEVLKIQVGRDKMLKNRQLVNRRLSSN